jgi:hypothetical protein
MIILFIIFHVKVKRFLALNGPEQIAADKTFSYDFHTMVTIGYQIGTILLIQYHYLLTYLLYLLSLSNHSTHSNHGFS